jgi:hypothetical protein
MVAEAANATVTVLRAAATTKYGQPDGWVTLYSGVPAILVDTLAGNANVSDTTPTGTRTVECHLPAAVGLRGSDHVRDEATGLLYLVGEISQPPTLIGAPVDTKVTLQLVTPDGG